MGTLATGFLYAIGALVAYCLFPLAVIAVVAGVIMVGAGVVSIAHKVAKVMFRN